MPRKRTLARFVGAAFLLGHGCLLAQVKVAEETAIGQKVVVLENQFIRIGVTPAKGGQCTEFLYKPSGKRFVQPHRGILLGNRVWNYKNPELYRQWQVGAWEYEVEKGPGEVRLHLHAKGKVNFTQSTHFEKTVTLRGGEALVRVTHTFHVGQELMQPFNIGLWFANQANVVGERTRYFFPLDDGIVSLDMLTATGQAWFYNPARGWAGIAGEHGDGLCFNMEFKRLMCFYLWPGRQPSIEWAFRTDQIKNGGALSTNELLVPFAGIPEIHGSGGGVVAGFQAPNQCRLDESKQGLAVHTFLASGTALKGELTLSMMRLPDGPPQAVQSQAVSLVPGLTAKIPAAMKPGREGTWLLSGVLTSGGKRVMDFRKPITVGKASGPVRILPREERIGRKSERFEDQTVLSGGGQEDLDMSMKVESPHVKWARPYRGGKLKVLVLTSCINGREAVELAQRMDMELLWVTAGTQYELNSFSWVFGKGRKFTYTVDLMNQNIKRMLSHACDAIIIGGIRGDLFSSEVLELLRKKVEAGTGLVYVAPNHGTDQLYSLLPVGKESRLRYSPSSWRFAAPHFLTTGIPFSELPPTALGRHTAKGQVLATIRRDPLLVVQDGPGKGRVVALTCNSGWQGPGGYSYGFMPWVEKTSANFKYWEYHFSFLIKAILWSARREPDVQLKAITATDVSSRPVIHLTLRNPNGLLTATAELTLSDAYGSSEYQESFPLPVEPGEREYSLAVPINLPGGLHLADVILRDRAGKVINWGSVSWRSPESITIKDISFDKRTYLPGETARVRVKMAIPSKKPLANAVLSARWVDGFGRLLFQNEQSLKPEAEPVATLDLPVGQPLSTTAKLHLEARVGGRPVSIAEKETFTFPERFARREWGDWENCIWGNPGGAYRARYLWPVYARLYRNYGVTTCLASANWKYDREYEWPVRSGIRIMPMNVAFGAISVGHRVPKGKMSFSEQKSHYQRTKDKKYLIRPVCLNSPADLEPLAQKLRQVAEYAGWLQPIGYNLGDEMSTTYYVTPYDYDFHPEALQAFRDWLKKVYGSLDALNAEWGSQFNQWLEVTPMTTLEVKGRGNYAPWADHREFMDVTFSNFFQWTRDRLQEKDPGAGVGMSGSQAAEAYGGYDWYRLGHTLDFVQNYTHKNTAMMQRSFGPNLPRAPWYGYSSRNPGMRQQLWWRLFQGNFGGSYWSATFMFRPDLLPSPMTADAAPIVKELQGGIAALLKNCQRQADIGIHYSHASIRGAFISQAAGLFRDNRGGWVKAMEDLGLQCEMLARPQIEAGELQKRKYRAFILPYSVAISEKEARALRNYLKNGGLLIADARTGLMDEHCRTLESGRLDELFGLDRGKADPMASGLEGEARFSSDDGKCKLAGLSFDVSVAEPSLEPGNGRPLGQHGSTPIAFVRKKGKGTAVFLNFFLDTFEQRRKLNMEKPLLQLCQNLLLLHDIEAPIRLQLDASPLPRTFIARYTSGRAEYYGIVAGAGDRPADWSCPMTVHFPKKAYVYDVRQKKELGRTDRASGKILAGDAALFACLPYRVRGIKVTSGGDARRGQVFTYQVAVRATGGRPGMHVVRMEVSGPDGQARGCYEARLVTRGGKADGAFTPALNDPTGTWTLRATDLVTGQSGQFQFPLGD